MIYQITHIFASSVVFYKIDEDAITEIHKIDQAAIRDIHKL